MWTARVQSAVRGERWGCYDVGEVHFDIGFARLSECMLGGDAEFGEAGGGDDVCIRRFGALVDKLENSSLEVGRESRHYDAQGSSKALAEVLQIVQRLDSAIDPLVPRAEVRHVWTVDNYEFMVALR